MESEFLFFLAILFGVLMVVFPIMAYGYRCRGCGSLSHGFKSDKEGDLASGNAYLVCRKCGDKQVKGKVESDGSVVWFSGGSGRFDEQGVYTGDAGGVFGDGGGGDGGGGGGE
jgi:DNA-directed RNA polymerase subunit RPC12/RpoP